MEQKSSESPLWLSSKQRSAYCAALALIAIQVAIGIIMKTAQTSGDYAFSASASLTISEFFKLLISTALFYREYRKRPRRTDILNSPESFELFLSPSGQSSARSSSDHSCEENSGDNEKESNRSSEDAEGWTPPKLFSVSSFWGQFQEEMSTENRYGFVQLALLYALINNTVSRSSAMIIAKLISDTSRYSWLTSLPTLALSCSLNRVSPS
jgi:hypothetical protein